MIHPTRPRRLVKKMLNPVRRGQQRLERFTFFGIELGFPNQLCCDSRCVLGLEASMHDATLFPMIFVSVLLVRLMAARLAVRLPLGSV